jgi:mannose-6-phosphate isomerase-like protein (cupin superfamily)
MFEPGAVFTSPRGTVVEILENTPERFRLTRRLAPGTGRTAPHRHLDGVERFEILEGEATGKVGRGRRRLAAGDVMDVPLGAAHVHPHTAAGATATILHTIEPRPRFVDVYFRTWLTWLSEGRVDRQDEPRLLGILAVLAEGGDGTWVAGPPIAVQRSLAAAAAPVARRRGYRPITP